MSKSNKSKAMSMIGVYVRVSTADQRHDSQELAIKGWLKGNGYDPKEVSWFKDTASRKDLDRTGFKALQQAIFNGEVTTVVVFRLDRVSGSMVDGLNTLASWMEQGVRLVSVSQQFDFKGVTGKLIASLLFGISEMEMVTRKERQAAGIASAKQRGVYKGRKKGTLKRKPRDAKELYSKGLNPTQIGNIMGVSRTTVIRYLGEDYNGKTQTISKG